MALAAALGLPGVDDPRLARSKLYWLRAFLLLLVAVEQTKEVLGPRHALGWSEWILPVVFWLCFLSLWSGIGPRLATAIAAGGRLVFVAQTFPLTANHVGLELVLLVLLSVFDPDDPDEGRLAASGIRWVAVIVMFYAGLQKLLHGFYFHGEFLASDMAYVPRLLNPLNALLSPAEYDRILALGEPHHGSGPYRVEELPFVVASNGVWLIEMLGALGLLWRRTRALAILANVGIAIFVQLITREMIFGLLVLNLSALFTARNLSGAAFGLSAAILLYLLAMALGLVPGWYFN